METQGRAFKETIELYTKNVREEVESIRKTVENLKTSLMFSQKDIDDFKGKIYETEDKLHSLEDSFARSDNEMDEIMDKLQSWKDKEMVVRAARRITP